jgi:hypothetical protein
LLILSGCFLTEDNEGSKDVVGWLSRPENAFLNSVLFFLLLEFLTEDSKGSEDCQCWPSVFSHPDHPCNPWFLDLTIQRFNVSTAVKPFVFISPAIAGDESLP